MVDSLVVLHLHIGEEDRLALNKCSFGKEWPEYNCLRDQDMYGEVCKRFVGWLLGERSAWFFFFTSVLF